jgi:GntR family transcriptional regulator, histidine utilization repressor
MGTIVASSEPHYQRLKRYIAEGILSGQWPPNDRLPSEGDLTRQFAVSRMTANRALRELADEGLITRVKGVGSFAAGPKAEATMIEVRDIRAEIEARAQHHQARVLDLRATRADAPLARQFEIDTHARIFQSQVLHSGDGEPLQLEVRYVNPACAPEYLNQDLEKTTAHAYLMRVAPLERAEHVIEAELADAKTAHLLHIAERAPLLIMLRRTWSRGTVASVARLVYPASRFRLVGHFKHHGV